MHGIWRGNADLRKCRESSVFASAIVTAALLGGTMKKPLAVTMLLFLCYPVKLLRMDFCGCGSRQQCLSLFDKRKVENKNPVEW